MIQRNRNTKEHGTIEFLVYKDADIYVGVCLTFDIVEEGSNPIELLASIKESAGLHLKTVINTGLSEDLLNRYAPEEYWNRYFEAVKSIQSPESITNNFPVVSPYYNNAEGILVS